jgi:hypothetical protein
MFRFSNGTIIRELNLDVIHIYNTTDNWSFVVYGSQLTTSTVPDFHTTDKQVCTVLPFQRPFCLNDYLTCLYKII